MNKPGPYAIWGLLGVVGIVLIGVALTQSSSANISAATEGRFDGLAVLSGNTFRNFSQGFEGGTATAVMGGLEVDLRDATMLGDEAVLEVFALMGAVELRVPDDWVVRSEVGSVFAGVENRARTREDGAKTLIVRGAAIFGGVDVRN